MKKVILFVFFTLIGIGYSSYSISSETISEERYNKVCKWWIFNPPECKKECTEPPKLQPRGDKWGWRQRA